MSNQEPAFQHDHAANWNDGMSLRDYFAAKAMQAMIAHHGIYDEAQPFAAMTSATAQDYHADSVSKTAYTYADAMLAARQTAR